MQEAPAAAAPGEPMDLNTAIQVGSSHASALGAAHPFPRALLSGSAVLPSQFASTPPFRSRTLSRW